jgi:hypothetical protein
VKKLLFLASLMVCSLSETAAKQTHLVISLINCGKNVSSSRSALQTFARETHALSGGKKGHNSELEIRSSYGTLLSYAAVTAPDHSVFCMVRPQQQTAMIDIFSNYSLSKESLKNYAQAYFCAKEAQHSYTYKFD